MRKVDAPFRGDSGSYADRSTVTAYLVMRADDGDDVDFLHADLSHAQRGAVGGEHPVGALHLAGDEQARRRVEPRARELR